MRLGNLACARQAFDYRETRTAKVKMKMQVIVPAGPGVARLSSMRDLLVEIPRNARAPLRVFIQAVENVKAGSSQWGI